MYSEITVAKHNEDAQPIWLPYRAYLVRLWRDGAQEPWRASTQSVQSGEVVRFATLQELFAFLEIHTPTPPQASQMGRDAHCD
jgi:hypothetical protein